MSKKKPTKYPLAERLTDMIESAADTIAKSHEVWDTSWRGELVKIAKEIGYAHPNEAACEIMTFLHDQPHDYRAQDLARLLKLYATKQELEWRQEDLNKEFARLETES